MAQRLIAFFPQLGEVVLAWLVPFSWIEQPPYPAFLNRLLPLALLFILAGALIWVGIQSHRYQLKLVQDEHLRWVAMLVFLIVLYLAVILFVYVTTYPPITIDNRMLSPVHVSLLLLIPALAALALRLAPKRWLRLALPLALLALSCWYGWRSVRIVQQNFETGLGYTSLAWQESETIRAVRELPDGQPLVTNETMAVLFLTGRSAYTFQEIYRDQPLEIFSLYGEGGDDPGQRAFAQGKAVLVLFNTLPVQLEGLYGQRTHDRIQALTRGLPVIFEGVDGTIYSRGKAKP